MATDNEVKLTKEKEKEKVKELVKDAIKELYYCKIVIFLALLAFILILTMVLHSKDALSGIVGSLITAGVAWLALNQAAESSKEAINSNTEALQFKNQLTLREMFSARARMRIHELLLLYWNIVEDDQKDEIHLMKRYEHLFIGKNDIASLVEIFKKGKANDSQKKEAEEAIEHTLQKDIANLYDYLGIFEIADDMLDKGVLDEELFKTSYKYRLETIFCAINNMKFLRSQFEPGKTEYWVVIKKLLKKFLPQEMEEFENSF